MGKFNKLLSLMAVAACSFGLIGSVSAETTQTKNSLPIPDSRGLITLEENVDYVLDATFAIDNSSNQSVRVIDLNGRKISFSQDNYAFSIGDGKTVRIEDSTGTGSITCTSSTSSCINNLGKLTLNNVTVTSENFIAVKNDGNDNTGGQGVMEINNSHIISHGNPGEAVLNWGKLTINNSEIEGTDKGIYAAAGAKYGESDITINGGSIKAPKAIEDFNYASGNQRRRININNNPSIDGNIIVSASDGIVVFGEDTNLELIKNALIHTTAGGTVKLPDDFTGENIDVADGVNVKIGNTVLTASGADQVVNVNENGFTVEEKLADYSDLFKDSKTGDVSKSATYNLYQKAIRASKRVTRYTSDSIDAIKAALEAIDNQAFDENGNPSIKISDQSTLDNLIDALQDAMNNIKMQPVDADLLQALKDAVEDADAKLAEITGKGQFYNGVNNFKEKLKAAKEILAKENKLNVDDNADIKVATYDLLDALSNLVKRDADYTELNKQLATAQDILDNNNSSKYTKDSYRDFLDAFYTAQFGQKWDVEHQDNINYDAAALETAIKGLVELDVDGLKESIDKAFANKDHFIDEYYDKDLLDKFDVAYKNANDILNNYNNNTELYNQQDVEDAVKALEKAMTDLLNITAKYDEDLVQKAQEAIDSGLYSKETVAELQTALDNLNNNSNLRAYQQDKVDSLEQAIKDILVKASLSKLREAIAQADSAIKDKNRYTADSYEALLNALNDVDAGLLEKLRNADLSIDDIEGWDINDQEQINQWTEAILNKFPLEELADTTKAQEAIDKARKLTEGDIDITMYTDDSREALEKASDALNAKLEERIGASRQQELDDLAAELIKAVENAQLKTADYTKVEEQKAQADALLKDEGKFTEESVKELKDALASVVYGKKITEQAEVNSYAVAIDYAIKGLTEKFATNASDTTIDANPNTYDGIANCVAMLISSLGVLAIATKKYFKNI